MTAQQARQLSDETNLSESNSALTEVRSKIEIAARRGAYSVAIPSGIHAKAIEKLKSEGYAVAHWSDQREGDSGWTISWAEGS